MGKSLKKLQREIFKNKKNFEKATNSFDKYLKYNIETLKILRKSLKKDKWID